MEIIFLGTNGWYSTELGNTVCILIESENLYVILDAGAGFAKLDRYIEDEKPIIVLLSHLHLDHIIGLQSFAKYKFKQKILIYGYIGTKNGLDSIIQHPYTAPLSDLPLDVEIQDLEEGIHNLPFMFKCKLLVHSVLCLGYRLELDNKIITYITDTSMCDNLYELSRNADLLISDCSFKPGQDDWGWPKLKPEEAAHIAKKMKTKRLILTHFDPTIHRNMEDRRNTEAIARKIFNETIAAYDDLKIEL